MAEMKGQRLARLLGGGGNVPLAQQRAMERLRMGREARAGASTNPLMPTPAIPRQPTVPRAGDSFGGQMIMPGQGGYYTDTTQQNFVPTPPVRRLPPQLPRVASEVGQYTPPVSQMPTMQQGSRGYIPDETGQVRPPQTITPTMQQSPGGYISDETNQVRPPQAMTPTAQRSPMISNAARSPFGRAMGGTGKSNAAPPRPRASAPSGSLGMANQAAY
jgi:hypothetical protein